MNDPEMLTLWCTHRVAIMCMETETACADDDDESGEDGMGPSDGPSNNDDDDDDMAEMENMCTCSSTCSMDIIPAQRKVGAVLANMNATEDDNLDLLCPYEATVSCMGDQSACIGDTSTEEVDSIREMLTGCADTWTPRPLAVAVTMALTVDDPEAFVQDPASGRAVARGIASAAGVSPAQVTVTLSVARRLQESDRRLQGSVNVDAEIEADNADAVADLETTVSAIETTTMTQELTTAISNAGITATVTVDSMSAEVAAPPVRQESLPALPSYDLPSEGGSGGGSGSTPTSSGASEIGVSSAFFIAAVMKIGM